MSDVGSTGTVTLRRVEVALAERILHHGDTRWHRPRWRAVRRGRCRQESMHACGDAYPPLGGGSATPDPHRRRSDPSPGLKPGISTEVFR